MTNNKSKPVGHKPGGGLNSNKAHNSKWRAKASPNRAVNPGYAAQLGTHVGNREGVEKMGNGKALSPPLGNELAAKVTRGPGGSRDVHKSGYQNCYGNPGPGTPVRPDLFKDFPPTKD
jgi:hypothetical protein